MEHVEEQFADIFGLETHINPLALDLPETVGLLLENDGTAGRRQISCEGVVEAFHQLEEAIEEVTKNGATFGGRPIHTTQHLGNVEEACPYFSHVQSSFAQKIPTRNSNCRGLVSSGP